MKTLIFTGTPRKNGDTMTLVNELVSHLQGEYKIVNAYDCNIKPCIDCRYCWKNEGCSIDDEMQEIYDYIQECDNVLIASPLYFSELTGPLLSVTSRLQTYYCAKFIRKVKPIEKEKKGGVILVGGGDGSIDKAYSTSRILLKDMNCTEIAPVVYSHNTDKVPSKNDIAALEAARELAKFFNEE